MPNYIAYHATIPRPSQDKQLESVIHSINKFSLAYKKISMAILSRAKNRGLTRKSQAYWGESCGYSRKTANKVIKTLVEVGLIHKEYIHRNTCIYTLTELSKNKNIFNTVVYHLKFAFLLSASLLLSKPTSSLAFNGEVTPNYKLNEIYIRNSHLYEKEGIKKTPDGDWLYKKERKISMYTESLKALREIEDKFPLTPHGFIRLCIYPPEAIKEAIARGAINPKAYDPFAYFASVCSSLCTPEQRNDAQYHKVREAMGISKEDAHYLFLEEFKEIYEEKFPSPAPSQKQKNNVGMRPERIPQANLYSGEKDIFSAKCKKETNDDQILRLEKGLQKMQSELQFPTLGIAKPMIEKIIEDIQNDIKRLR